MTSKARKPYRKPEVTQVKLVSKEAVLASCKTATSGDPAITFTMFCGDLSGAGCNALIS